jgi:uncharacterized OsmC-like protein
VADGLEVVARFEGGFAATVTARGHSVRVDEPDEVGGTDTGAMPTELFAMALASCFALAVGWAARKRGLEVPGLEVTVRAERAGRDLRYGRLSVRASAGVDPDLGARLVERAVPVCWVSNTLAAGVEVDYGFTSLDAR